MSEKRMVVLLGPEQRRRAKDYIDHAPVGFVMKLTEQTRSLEQNAKLWPMLQDISKQVDWYGQKLTDEEWKDVFSAALKKQKVVPSLDGGFVVCGQRTSQMGKKEFADLIELMYAFGAERNVRWSEPEAEMRRAA
jgi:hypothetical protein